MNSIAENTGTPKNAPVYIIKCHIDNRFVPQKVFTLYFSNMATVE